MHQHHSRLEQLGRNLADLVETGAAAALTVTALGVATTRFVVGAPFREGHRDCSCARHHYHCCYEPPIYDCRG
ncbi:MAG TPA: hypothetical protein VGI79_20650 [Caulobacteraceae bacterium]|jgi:hypothetical protein